jgi:UDP-N-acetylmuramate dehydrogenase
MSQKQVVSKIMSIAVEENISLKEYTTMNTGGVARYFVKVESVEEVIQAARFAEQKALPVLVLGGGSNMLISDEGFDGLAIQNNIKGRVFEESEDEVVLTCGAGEVFDEVVAESVARGYWGLENLSAIPGSVGGTPVQNVGAYGVEVSELIVSVEAVDLENFSKIIFTNLECDFSYRESFFKKENGKKYFITSVQFKLRKKSNPKIDYADLKKYFTNHTPSISEVREAVVAIRSKKFPDWNVVGTAGSFFKNPIVQKELAEAILVDYPELPVYDLEDGTVKIPLGYVLDKICGLKGYREDKIGLFEAQALVLVNYDNATTSEIKTFAAKIAQTVFEKTKIIISPEVRYIENKK